MQVMSAEEYARMIENTRRKRLRALMELAGGVLVVGGFLFMMVYCLIMWLSEPSLYGTY